MIYKSLNPTEGRNEMEVTFCLPECIWADKICLVGDFNDWHHSSHPLNRDHNEKWTITISLDLNKAYQFRYLIDGDRWTNDDKADAYTRNFTGSNNFIVITDPAFEQYNDN